MPENLFLKKIDDWTPRDVTAHLIGWNLYKIKGCQQIMNGEIPFYFIDPGEDYSKINAVLVREYDSRDIKELISQLNASAEKLSEFLNTIDPADWEADFGVKLRGKTITIKNSLEAMAYDFINHRRQIEKWAEEKTK
ncbi:MAG TPA: ClbS/DfsB family four-helix bundle protein [Dehalococcoidia bacterium]|nr:ClbS/DfsB family four-helix bundle protein [Dehalococcoidia bacterium]